eukprot:scaffold772_cov361-Prasinococcus_capsulatus_cf.AAC.3
MPHTLGGGHRRHACGCQGPSRAPALGGKRASFAGRVTAGTRWAEWSRSTMVRGAGTGPASLPGKELGDGSRLIAPSARRPRASARYRTCQHQSL